MRKISCARCKVAVVTKYPKKTGNCRSCDNTLRSAEYRRLNRTKVLAYQREYTAHNRAAILDSKRKYNSKNRVRVNAKIAEYRKANPAVIRARGRLYEARKRRQLPAWADLVAIKEKYSNRPEGHHVDHIVPLKGKNVCGLHVEYNLQYLPATENMVKGNKFSE